MNVPLPRRYSRDRDVARGFVATAGGPVHYRCAGAGPALVLLHDSPRSSRLHLDTMRQLAAHFTVYALDTPGYGSSAPLGHERPAIADFAVALAAALDAMGLRDAPLYATHTSAKIALEYGAYHGKPPLLVLDGLSIPTEPPDPGFISIYMRPFQLDDASAYLAREWTRARDMVRWFPWFDARPETRMATAVPDEALMADYIIDLLSAGPHYSDAYAAAMYYDPMPALRSIAAPTRIIARTDDVLYAHLGRIPTAANPALTVQHLSDDREQWLESLQAVFASTGSNRLPDTGRIPELANSGPVYVRLPHGQMLVHREGRGSPLLVLEAPTTRHALEWQRQLCDDRQVLVPELPGYGESDPLGSDDLAEYADSLSVMIDALDLETVDVLALGYATPLGAMLAARHPGKVDRLILDGGFVGDDAPDHRQDAVCPAISPEAGGGHLHRIWHMLRDGDVQWPWFDGDIAAQRDLCPLFDAENLHRALIGILKQPGHYGDVLSAVVRADAMASYGAVRQPCLLFLRTNDPGYRTVEQISRTIANVRWIDRPATIEAAAEALRAALAFSPFTAGCMEASI